MPALNYDYDYYEYRNGRRVGSSVSKNNSTISTNRTYNAQRNTAVRRNIVQTSNIKKVNAQVRSTSKNKQNVTTRKVNASKVAKPNVKVQSTKKSKIDIPLESSKKIANKPEAMKLNAPKSQSKINTTSILKNAATVSVFFCLFFVVCYRYSLINEQFSGIKKLKTELATIQTANEQVQADIESKTDLTYVENYAKYQLGMQKPTSSQIQYIKVDKQDRISTPITINEEEEMNWFENIIDSIRKYID